MILDRSIAGLRQRAAPYAGTWRAVGREVFDDQHARVALASDGALAGYLADLHNVFLPLANAWLMTRKALRDREAMTKILKHDA